nr:hypothetical protein HmN_000649100 [Hymenolepis microstoma]
MLLFKHEFDLTKSRRSRKATISSDMETDPSICLGTSRLWRSIAIMDPIVTPAASVNIERIPDVANFHQGPFLAIAEEQAYHKIVFEKRLMNVGLLEVV